MTQIIVGNVKRDRLIRKTESLMLKGLDSASEVSKELKINFRTAASYIQTVRDRWSSSKSIEELSFEREQLINKVKQVIRDSWNLRDKSKNALEANACLRTILLASEQLRRLLVLDNVPLETEKHTEEKISLYAQEIHALPEKSRKIILDELRRAIKSN